MSWLAPPQNAVWLSAMIQRITGLEILGMSNFKIPAVQSHQLKAR
jgi:hypothetical protein